MSATKSGQQHGTQQQQQNRQQDGHQGQSEHNHTVTDPQRSKPHNTRQEPKQDQNMPHR